MSEIKMTDADIKHLGKLANLPLIDSEINSLRLPLAESLDYVKNLSDLKTENAKETHHTGDLLNQTFADGTKNKRLLTPEQATANAAFQKKGYFVVKRIMHE